MILEAGILLYLTSVPAIAALVDARVYGLIGPQAAGPLPEILFQRTNTQRQVKYCGTDALAKAQMQVDVYGMTGEQSWPLAKVLRDNLIDYSGNMGDVYVSNVTLENEFPLNDSDPGIIRVSQLYTFWYLED